MFGEGGVARCAAASGTELLGQVPLLQRIREAADAGTPVTLAAEQSAAAAAPYARIARRIAAQQRFEHGEAPEVVRQGTPAHEARVQFAQSGKDHGFSGVQRFGGVVAGGPAGGRRPVGPGGLS